MRGKAAVLAVLTMLALAACQGSTYPAPPSSYRVGPGPKQLTIIVSGDEPGQAAHASVVQETDKVVQIRVELDSVDAGNPEQPPIGAGVQVEATVDLAEPLGSRRVLDENDDQVLHLPDLPFNGTPSR